MASVILFLLFLAALLQPGLPNPLMIEPTAAWLMLCYGFAAIVLTVHFARGGTWRLSPFDAVLGAYLIMVLVTWPTSVDRHETGLAIARLLGQVVVFCAVRVLAESRPFVHRLCVAALVVGFAVIAWIATDFHLRVGLDERLIAYPSLEWNGRSGLGTAGAIQFGLLVGLWQDVRSRAAQICALFLVVVAAGELIFFYSRDPWIAACAVLVAAGLMAIRRGGMRRFAIAAAVIVASVGLIRTPYVDRLVRLAAGIEQGQEGGIALRLVGWSDAVVMIRQHALVGVGLGNFIAVRQVNGSLGSPDVLVTQPLPIHPHNMYLQQLAEVGVVGGTLYIALWLMALWAGWQVGLRCTNQVGVRLSAFYALVAIVVMNLGENMFLDAVAAERVRFHTIAWMLLALVIAEWNRVRRAVSLSEHVAAA